MLRSYALTLIVRLCPPSHPSMLQHDIVETGFVSDSARMRERRRDKLCLHALSSFQRTGLCT